MDPKKLEEAKEVLKKVKESQEPSSVLKRATMLAVVLGFVQSSAVIAADNDVNKLVNSLSKSNVLGDQLMSWRPGGGHGGHNGGWRDWKNWKDWSDWKDWKNWNDWKDWKDWNDWKNWNDWRDWKNYRP